MLVSFFVGSVVGGAMGGLSFDPGAAGIGGVVMYMLCKIFLMAVFVAIDVALSAATKQKTWLAFIGAFCVGILLFMMIPMITPLDATITNVIVCLVAGVLFSLGLGAVSNLILQKTSLV